MTLVAVLLFGGCGEGSDDGTDTETASENAGSGARSQGDATGAEEITKAEFVRRANGICRIAAAKVLDAATRQQRKSGAPSSEAERISSTAELASTVLAPALRTEAKGIEDLGVPPGDERQVGAILGRIKKIAKQAEENPREVARDVNPFAEVTALAERYGLSSCPYGGG